MRSSRYVFFGAALHWLAVFVFLEAVSSGMGSKKHVVYWNTTNPIFRIDNTDHIIDVNRGNIPYEYDQVNLVCPSYTPSTPEDEAEKYIIYNVSKEEFDTCRITNPNPRIIAVCDKPHKLLYFTITFRSFTPQPGGLEFRPGQDYYFISTSSKDDLHRRIGGRCKTSNMRIVFKVCCKPGEEPENQRPAIKGDKKELTVGKNGTMDATSSTQGHPPAAGMDLPSNNVDSSAEPTDRQQPPQHHLRHDDTDISGTRLAEEFSRIPTLSGGASNGGGNQRWSPPRVLTTRRPGSSSFDDLLGSNDLPTDYLGRNPASDSSLSISTSEPPFKNKNFGYPIFSVKSTNKKPDFKYDRSGNEVVKEELSSSASTNLLRHRELCLALAFLVAFFLPRVHVR